MATEETAIDPAELVDGRYIGSNGRYWLELRVDLRAFHMISGELQYFGPAQVEPSRPPAVGCGPSVPAAPTRHNTTTGFYASFRTTGVPQSGVFPIKWTGLDGAVEGSLEFTRSTDSAGGPSVTLRLNAALGGLPAETEVTVAAVRAGDALRVLGLEIEREEGVEWPGEEVPVTDPAVVGRPSVGVRECLGRLFRCQDRWEGIDDSQEGRRVGRVRHLRHPARADEPHRRGHSGRAGLRNSPACSVSHGSAGGCWG